MDRLVSFKENGCTGMIVSHAPQAVLRLCDEAIWIDHGRIVTHGPAEEVVAHYVKATGTEPEQDVETTDGKPEQDTEPKDAAPEEPGGESGRCEGA